MKGNVKQKILFLPHFYEVFQAMRGVIQCNLSGTTGAYVEGRALVKEAGRGMEVGVREAKGWLQGVMYSLDPLV